MSSDPLRWAALCRAWRPDEPEPPPTPSIVRALDDAFARASARWPGIAVPESEFAAAIGRAAGTTPDAASAIDGLAAADLYLATGCALGIGTALAAFEAEFGARLDARVQRLTRPAEAPDLQQNVRLKLLVGEGRPPRIAEYHGVGRLDPWLRVVVARMSVDAQRRRAPESIDSDEQLLPAVADDPELQYLKTHYAGAMREAIAQAAAALPARDRLLLRYQLVDRLTSEQIGVIYNVHGATVRRWVTKARARLLATTHERIAARLAVSPDEFTSIVRLVRSQLDVSIARLLSDGGED